MSWKRYKLRCACCCCSVTKLCLTLHDPMNAAHHPSQSPVFAQIHSIESVMLSNHLILCCPLLLLPSVFRTIRVFSNESALCIRWQKYWSFSNSPSNEYSGLTSFRIKWFNLLAVQGTLKNTLQYQSLKASVLQCSAFFTSVYDYWKNHSFEYTDLCQQSDVSGF